MDLNKAMVELYKIRSASSSKKNIHPKTEANTKLKKPDSSSGTVAANFEEAVPSKKRMKYGDVLASMEYKPKAQFDDLYGCESVRDKVIKITATFVRAIEGQDEKCDLPVLICGSQGLGKTSIVEAAANQADLKLIPIPLKKLVEQTRNKFEVTLKELVYYALSNQPAIVLFDNLEEVAEKDDLRILIRNAVETLSIEVSKILIFCTTSSDLDSSFGLRFFKIHLKRPDSDARYKIMHSLRDKNKNLSSLTDDCLKCLATKMPAFTPLDIKDVLKIARVESNGQPTLVNCEHAIENVKQSFKRGTHLIGEKPTVTWEDIGGLASVRQDFLNILEEIRSGGMNCKYAGIALYGPPGCGKTMVAQAIANEAGFNFISIKPTELMNKFLGETERNIRKVFSDAREFEPCVIYFDEFDGLCGTRGNRDTVTSAIQTLLSEMDGFADRGNSIILVSTNRLEDIDSAMKRPGRLSEHIFVGPPDAKARLEILNKLANRPGISLGSCVDLEYWANKTENCNGADLGLLMSKAKLKAKSSSQLIVIKRQHLDQAFDQIISTNQEIEKKIKT